MSRVIFQLLNLFRRSNCFANALIACLCLLIAAPSAATAQVARPVQPIYWQQPLLFIPYQINNQVPATRDIAQVQLLLSRTGANDWVVLQSAQPNVQGFSYHAPADGRYWFALKHLDAQGQPLDGTSVVPQLQLVIDTQMPQLALSTALEVANQIVIRYEATDANLQPDSLILEARPADGLWTNVSIGPPEVAQADRIAGSVRWPLPTGTGEIEIRGSIADGTGQRGQASAIVPLTGPRFAIPDRTSPSPELTPLPNVATGRSPFAAAERDPFQSASSSAQDWPANNQLPTAPQNMTPVAGTPPAANSYLSANVNHNVRRTPAKFAVDGAENSGSADANSFAPNLINANQSQQDAPVALPATDESNWSSTGRATDGPMLVNARTFDVEYDLQSVGPWGVAKVELWGTQDGGNTWQSFGVDPDNRSPVRVTVPNAGTFGFRILVEGANGVGATPPQSGAEPELVVSVDLQPPTAELLAAEPGEGNLSDHLRIRWTATDENLEPRPIGLFYSSFPNGPWSTVAAGLENTGSYVWRIERHVPGRFYLRLEARDTAGNVATFQTPEPLTLNRPQPTGTLRNVRPIDSVPTVRGG
jgi:hypothetical protein